MDTQLAPEVFRQRLLIEGYFDSAIDEFKIRRYFQEITEKLSLRAYGEPIIFSPSSGMGSEGNAGYDAFIPLIDSGISLYVWSKAKFFSTIIYTCKGFSEETATAFTTEFFSLSGDVCVRSF